MWGNWTAVAGRYGEASPAGPLAWQLARQGAGAAIRTCCWLYFKTKRQPLISEGCQCCRGRPGVCHGSCCGWEPPCWVGVSQTCSPSTPRAGLFYRDKGPDQGQLGEHRGRRDAATLQLLQRPISPACRWTEAVQRSMAPPGAPAALQGTLGTQVFASLTRFSC